MTPSPLRVAIIGMGGFASEHHDAILRLEARGECRLLCTCDPNIEEFTERWEALRFEERGVRLFRDYRDMLAAFADELDLVTIPTPVPLHAPMHRAACRRGLAAYLEKPPTLNYKELETMRRAEKMAPKLTNVGFNFIIEPQRRALKARLAAGEFGSVREVRVFGRWPRGSIYYTRANWAGRLLLDGKLVLDSPMGNAMAHLTHNALYWAGDAPDTWAPITTERAELYRAHAIQGTDTVFVEAETAGPIVRIAMTHACIGESRDYEEVVCDNAVLTTHMGWTPDIGHFRDFTLRRADGREETERLSGFRHLDENFLAYFAYLRGERPRPVTTLTDCRPFVHFNDLAYLAAGRITPVPEAAVRRERDATRGAGAEIAEIDAIMTRFLQDGDFPSAQDVSWAVPGGAATPKDLPRLAETVAGMAE